MADFHFLRPFWLLLVLAVPALYWLLRGTNHGDSGWSRLIPRELLTPLVRVRGRQTASGHSPFWPASVAVTILAIALAGPAWREAPTPLKQPGDSLVMVLDLSLSMLATDVEPDRLTRAKRKIRDILDMREGSLNALVVYAADAHVVTPLTDDVRTIEAMLSVLNPVIMPAQGNRADLAINRARDLLEQGAPGRGRILLITDEIRDQYQHSIGNLLQGSRYALSTLVVGTEEGGPIPLAKRGFLRNNGDIVITRADPASLSEVARRNGGRSRISTLDDSDIRALDLAPTDQDDWQSTDPDLSVSRWQDDGYWLLWLAVPLVLLGWRRGALAGLALVLLPLAPQPAEAMSWESLWLREDQRGPELIREDPERATRELRQPEWRAPALYRSGDYDQAAALYDSMPGPEADYNRGNALAHAGKFEQAITAYDQALALDPELEDARHNRKLVEQLLRQQQNQQGQGNAQDQQNGQGQEQGQQNQSSGEGDQNSQSGQSQQDGEQHSGQQPNSANNDPSGQSGSRQQSGLDNQGKGDAAPDSGNSSGAHGEQTEGRLKQQVQAPADISETPLTQAQEQWLRRVPDNPGGLMRRKFLQQYQERQTQSDEGDTPW